MPGGVESEGEAEARGKGPKDKTAHKKNQRPFCRGKAGFFIHIFFIPFSHVFPMRFLCFEPV
jgi:hypothetical protein